MKIFLIDVRNKEEFENDNIKGSINIPLDQILSGHKINNHNNEIIYLYCQSGKRSKLAFDYLENKMKKCIDFGSIENAKESLKNKL